VPLASFLHLPRLSLDSRLKKDHVDCVDSVDSVDLDDLNVLKPRQEAMYAPVRTCTYIITVHTQHYYDVPCTACHVLH